MKQFDFLVLGSGIAGLFFALKVAPHGRVAIVTKKDRAESNTNYAQGGIAAVTSKEDSFELHVRDTLEAGAGLCKEDVVRTIVEEGPARIAELIELGMQFTEREIPALARRARTGPRHGRRPFQAPHPAREGHHRAARSSARCWPPWPQQPNIADLREPPGDRPDHEPEARLRRRRTAASAPMCSTSRPAQVETFAAPVTLLATGGCGKVYLYTTNPDIATGDGVAMA